MPVIRLYPEDGGRLTVRTPAGPTRFPQLRLHGWAEVGDETASRQVVIDTGAPACLIPRAIWTGLHDRGQVEWVSYPPDAAAETLPTLTMLGGRYPYRVGRVRVRLVDLSGASLPGRPVPAILTEDAAAPLAERVVIGLAGVLDGRTLAVQASEDGTRWVATLIEP